MGAGAFVIALVVLISGCSHNLFTMKPRYPSIAAEKAHFFFLSMKPSFPGLDKTSRCAARCLSSVGPVVRISSNMGDIFHCGVNYALKNAWIGIYIKRQPLIPE